MSDTAEYSRRLADLVNTLLDLKWRMDPVTATAMGIHTYDHTLGDFSPEAFDRLAAEFRACRWDIQSQVEPTRLDADDRTDYQLAMSLASSGIIRLECLRDWERDPSLYPRRAIWGIYLLLAGEFAPAEERMQSILRRMRELPEALDLARRNLTRAPRLFTQIGMQVTERSISFLQTAISKEGVSRDELLQANEVCIAALEAYRRWLEDDLMPNSRLDCSIGAHLYEQVLFADHYLTYSPDSIVRLGRGALINIQDELAETARRIDPSKSWQDIVQRLKHDHPSADELLPAYRTAVNDAREFVSVLGLISGSELLEVLPTPEFLRGIFPHTAYMPPPPFEEDGRHGHFWVTPVDQMRSPEEQEHQLEGHSRYSIPVTAMHESYPGRHLQFSIGALADRSMRKQANSHLFAEGWALYCGQMMHEQGLLTDPRVRLFHLKDSLRHACRALVDVGLQTGEISFHGAVGLLVETARLDEATAVAEVQRHAVRPARAMASTIGMLLILSARDEQKRRLGSKFNLAKFHRQLLGYGTIPTPLIAERLALDPPSAGTETHRRAA